MSDRARPLGTQWVAYINKNKSVHHVIVVWLGLMMTSSTWPPRLTFQTSLPLSTNHETLHQCRRRSPNIIRLCQSLVFVAWPSVFLANTRHSPDAVSMLIHRLRRWPNIETASGECQMFAGVQYQSHGISKQANVNLMLSQGHNVSCCVSVQASSVRSVISYRL